MFSVAIIRDRRKVAGDNKPGSITAAPFKANRSTEYSGNLFSSGGELGLSLATEWDTPVTGEW